METLTLVAILAVSTISALYWYVTKSYRYWSDRGISGPKPKPFVGNMHTVATESSAIYEPRWAKEYGKLYGTYIGFQPTLTVMDPDLVKQVMVKDFNLFVNRRQLNFYHEVLSQNLFSLPSDRWKTVRTIVTPSFSSGKLRGMHPIINRCVDKLVVYLERLVNDSGKTSIKIKEVIIGFTLDMIAATAFATETNANEDRVDAKMTPFLNYANKLFQLSWFRTISLTAFPRWINDLLNFKVDVEPESYDYFEKFLIQIVKQRKSNTDLKRNDLVQLLLDASIDETELSNTSYSKLDSASEPDDNNCDNSKNQKSTNANGTNHKSERKLTDNEIVAQALIFFMAGYETTASSISYVLYELAINPEIQQRLVDELETKLNDIAESKRNSEDYFESVMKIPYLDAVIKETLRKYPPISRVERRVSVKGYRLGGVELYKDQLVEVPVYAIHHSEEYYPEPERFDPERFMPENKDQLVPYTYLPFGTGPRNCVGMRFAYQVVKLCLTQIVLRFRFSPSPNTPVPLQFKKGSFILCPVTMPITVSKRV